MNRPSPIVIIIAVCIMIWAFIANITSFYAWSTAVQVEKQVAINTPLISKAHSDLVLLQAQISSHNEVHRSLERELDGLRNELDLILRENQQLRRLLALRVLQTTRLEEMLRKLGRDPSTDREGKAHRE